MSLQFLTKSKLGNLEELIVYDYRKTTSTETYKFNPTDDELFQYIIAEPIFQYWTLIQSLYKEFPLREINIETDLLSTEILDKIEKMVDSI